jgi:Protein of Unknown function (DUF2784)
MLPQGLTSLYFNRLPSDTERVLPQTGTVQTRTQASDVNIALPYQLLADVVLSVHFGIVLFVAGGLVFIVVGGFRGWPLVRKLWFRAAYLTALAVVVAQAWLGTVCPLTTLEMWLRARAREGTYSGSFIEHWLARLLYYEAPGWVFTVAYSAFGLAVVASWWVFPPKTGLRSGGRGGPA